MFYVQCCGIYLGKKENPDMHRALILFIVGMIWDVL